MTDTLETAIIETPRLRLAPFAVAHAPALNAINNEPEVMEFLTYGDPVSFDETLASIGRVRDYWTTRGYSWWAVMTKSEHTVIGAACLQNVANEPEAELEIGWRLATAATGHGYATEAGKAAADYAFDVVGVDHVIAVANPRNIASHRVMERLGMRFRGIETHYNEPCTTYVLYRQDRPT